MAANDYYRDSQSSLAPLTQHASPQQWQNYGYNQSHSSSQQDVPLASGAVGGHQRPPQSYQESSTHDHYADDIPMRQHNQPSNLNTSHQNWPPPDYPPSPENYNPQLLPETQGTKRKRRKNKKGGFFSGKIPWVCYTLSLVQITVFIVEIIKNSIITGSPIMIHPYFNPMIGPSTYVQINMGARFVPCMRITPNVQNATQPVRWPCPDTTTSDLNDPSNQCDLRELCGFNDLDNDHPNQWYRFILPMFLHAGLIHIAFNLLLQLTMGREMEKSIGSIRFAIVYFSSGIFGFVLGGNYAAPLIASTGASGCLFGILAVVLLDLIYTWNERKSPVKELMWLLVDIIISFVLGLLPGLDNFSHIGGFLMGLAAGLCLLHSPNQLRQRIGEKPSMPYRNVDETDMTNPKASGSPKATTAPVKIAAFTKDPVNFFRGRKPLWWGWWILRVGALIAVLVGFIVLLNNFYKYHDTCSWCKYLSCLPVNNWCEIGNLNITSTNTTDGATTKRDLLGLGPVLVSDLFDMAM